MTLHFISTRTLLRIMAVLTLIALFLAAIQMLGTSTTSASTQLYVAASGDSLTRVTAAGYSSYYADCRPDSGWTIFDGAQQMFPRSPLSCTDTGFLSFKESLKQRIIKEIGEDFFNALVP